MNDATTLAARVDQYLAERRRLGFELWTMGYALHSLVEHVRRCGHSGPLTLELMAQWAPQAKQGPGDRTTWARRLELLRPFTRWLRQFEPDTEVPEEPIFGRVPGRVAPHIYNDDEIAALLDAAGRIGPLSSPRGAVVQTVFALMACTGLRVSEALALTDADVDWKAGVLTVRDSKCGRSRLVPLHPSAVVALRRYRAPNATATSRARPTRRCSSRAAAAGLANPSAAGSSSASSINCAADSAGLAAAGATCRACTTCGTPSRYDGCCSGTSRASTCISGCWRCRPTSGTSRSPTRTGT